MIAKHPTQATVFEEAVRRSWKIPYVSIAAAEITPGDTAKPYDPPPEPAKPKSSTGFALGDRVSFDDGKGIRSSGWWRRSTGVQRRSRPTTESPGASTSFATTLGRSLTAPVNRPRADAYGEARSRPEAVCRERPL